MTSKKSKPKSQPAPKPKPKAKKMKAVRRSYGLNQHEMAYARLLDDPCSAPLTHGLWPGSNGSVLQRFEADFIPAPASGTASTAYAFAYIPGSNYAFELAKLGVAGTITDTELGVFKRQAALEVASAAVNNFGHTRSVATCVQVYWPGSESTRSGIVSMGIIPAAALHRAIQDTQGGSAIVDSVTCAQLRSNCVMSERMPQNKLEIKWFPGPGDAFPFNVQQKIANAKDAFPDASNSKNAVLVVVSGFPPGVFPRIRIVNAVEWTGAASLVTGSVLASLPEERSGTLDNVLKFLGSKDNQWYLRQAANVAVQALSSTMVRYGNGATRVPRGQGRIEL